MHIFGHDITRESSEAKRCLGVVPQEFNFNVFEPLEEILVNQAGYYGVARKEAFNRAAQQLQRFDLWDKRRDMARELSGGMKRRLMIARALMHNPEILILDEPTAGVDIEIRRGMWDFLQELNQQGVTIILTTHYLEEAEQLCDHIAIINNGEIIKNCAKKELLEELGSECLLLELKTPVESIASLSEYPTQLIDKNTLEVEVKKNQRVNQLFEVLSRHGIEVLSVRNKSNRLERLFLQLVQHKNVTSPD